MIFVYFLAFILNYRNTSKFRGQKSPLFLVIVDLYIVTLYNIIFNYLAIIFEVKFYNYHILILMWGLGLITYFLNLRYACITYVGFVFYFLSLLFGCNVDFKCILFLIGVLHIFEGMYIILVDSDLLICEDYKFGRFKLFLPVILSDFVVLFLISYRRRYRTLINRGFKTFSGTSIFVYGITTLLISRLNMEKLLNVLCFLFVILLHEFMTRFDKVLYIKIIRLYRKYRNLRYNLL